MTIEVTHRQLLTVRQASARLAISEKSVRRLIARGELPAVQLGGPRNAVRIDAAELEDWLYGPRAAA